MLIELDETKLISTPGICIRVNVGTLEHDGVTYDLDMLGGSIPFIQNCDTKKALKLDWETILRIAISLGINKPDVSTNESAQ